ncbi:transcriptional regulator [Virgibacillus oceani]
MQLKRSTFKYIEAEVYNLHETLKEIELTESELLDPYEEEPDDPTIVKGANSVRIPGDPTGKTATLLVEHKTLQRMKQVSGAIKKVYAGLIPEKQEVIKIYYWDKPGELTWDGVAKETDTSRRTAIRWRKHFIYEIAKELGER